LKPIRNSAMQSYHANRRANKTDAGIGSEAICCVSNVLRSPASDPKHSPN